MRANITLNPRQLTLAVSSVAAGGAAGTLLRALALRVEGTHWYQQLTGSSPAGHIPWWGLIPWVLLLINAAGVYLATRLLAGPLRHRDPNDLTRLLVITGFFGGFTSYSSLFVSLAQVWHDSAVASLFVAFVAVGSGVGAGWLGLKRPHR